MDEKASPEGEIVFLNGTSSAGKTELAQAFQDEMDRPFFHTGIDQFFYHIPPALVVNSDGQNPSEARGWLVVWDEDSMVELRIGPFGYRILDAMYHAVEVWADDGIDVVVDDLVFEPEVLKMAVERLARFDVLFVAVECPLEVAENREASRPERVKGAARAFHQLVHRNWHYDLTIDTSLMSPEQAARRLRRALTGRSESSAFRDLYRDWFPSRPGL